MNMKEVNIKVDMSDLDNQLITKIDNIEKTLELILNQINKNVLPPVITIPEIPISIPIPSNYIYLEDFGSDMNKAWREAMQVEGKVLKLKDNKTYIIDEYETVEPKLIAIVGNLDESKSPDLIIGSWTKEVPDTLFRFKKSDPRFAVVGINLLQPKGQTFKTALQNKYLYDCELDLVKTSKLALIGSKVKDKNQLCWAIAETVYSSGDSSIGFMDFIVKDVVYNGPVFQQLKTSGGNNIRSIWWNFNLNNPSDYYMDGKDIYYLATHYYNPVSFIATGIVSDNKIELTSNHTFDLIKTHHGYEDAGVRSILNIGRFVFNIYDDSISSNGKVFNFKSAKAGDVFDYVKIHHYGTKNKTIATSFELQAGDVTDLGKVIEKQLNYSTISYGVDNWPRWIYVLDTEVNTDKGNAIVLNSTFDLSGVNDIAFGFKYNAMISSPFLTENTKFGEWQILTSGGMGWSVYDHKGINIYWKNVNVSGFMRQSESEIPVKCLGYNMENVNFLNTVGEFKIQEPFKNKVDFPQDVIDYINYVESL